MKNPGQTIAMKKVMVITGQTETETVQKWIEFKYGCRCVSRPSTEIIPEQLLDYDLVLIAGGKISPELRILPVPIIVLDPLALAPLGLVENGAEANYGTTNNSFVSITQESALSGSLCGDQRVLTDRKEIGWGRPGQEAIVTATLPGAANQAAIFGYDWGTSMFGFKAPQTRVAFLIATDPSATITNCGWLLLEAAIQWALLSNRKVSQEDTKGGFWYVEGKPTKVLNIDEYRDWVEEKVTRKLLFKLTLGGSLGITAIVASILWFKTQLHTYFDDQIKTTVINQVDPQLTSFKTGVNQSLMRMDEALGSTNVDKIVTASMAQIFFHRVELDDRMVELAKNALSNAIPTQSNLISGLVQSSVSNEVGKIKSSPAFLSAVQEAKDQALAITKSSIDAERPNIYTLAKTTAVNAVTNFGEIVSPILLPRIENQELDPDQREESMRLLSIFGVSPVLYHKELLNIINGSVLGTEALRSLALRNCPVVPNDPENNNLFESVLSHVRQISLSHSFETPTRADIDFTTVPEAHVPTSDDAMNEAYSIFLSKFPQSFATTLSFNILNCATNAPRQILCCQILANALAKMKGDQPSLELVSLANRAELEAVRLPLLNSLSQRTWKFEDENNRWLTISNIWNGLQKSADQDELKWQPTRDAIMSANAKQLVIEINKVYPTNRPYFVERILTEVKTPQTNIDWRYVAYLSRGLANDYTQERHILQRLFRQDDWPLVRDKLWPQSTDDPTGAKLAWALLSSWQNRSSDTNSGGLSDAALDLLIGKTCWVYNNELAQMLEIAVDRYQGSNRIQVVKECQASLLDQINTNKTTLQASAIAMYVVAREDTNAPDQCSFGTNLISKSFGSLKGGYDTNKCSAVLQMLLQYANNAPDPRRLLPALTNGFPLITNTACQEIIRQAECDASDIYVGMEPKETDYHDALSKRELFQIYTNDLINAIQLNPTNDGAFNMLGLSEIALGDLTNAETYTRKAIEIRLDKGYKAQVSAQENLGLIYIARGDWSSVMTNCLDIEQALPAEAFGESWNTVFKLIAAKKLGKHEDVENAKYQLRRLGWRLDTSDLGNFLPDKYLQDVIIANDIAHDTMRN